MLIELGEERPGPVPARRPPHRLPRWPVLAGVVLALLLGGAAAPGRALVPLFRVPYAVVGSYALGTDTLYAATGTRISAYGLPSGTHRWDATAPFPTQSLWTAGDVVLGMVGGSGPQLGTVAFDAGTGRRLWDEPAQAVDVVGGTAVLETVGDQGPTGLHGVDLRTGRTVWTGPRIPDTWPILPNRDAGAAGRMVFWVPDAAGGTTRVVSEATGQLLTSARLPIGAVGGLAGTSALTIADGLLIVAWPEGRGTRITAYRLDDLGRRWQILVDSTGYGAVDCGPVLCLYGYNQLTGLDPATGAVRWQTNEWIDAEPLPGGRVLLSSSRQGSDRLLADATTLRTIATMTPWEAVGGQAPPPLLLSRDVPSLRSWFAELPPGAAAPRLLGSVAPVQRDQCTVDGRYLACPTVHNELRVWRYRLTRP